MEKSNSRFHFPPNLPESDQLDFCLTILGKFQYEQAYLRRQTATLLNERNKARKDAAYWKKKYQEEKEKAQRIKRENDKLVKDLERLLVTKNRYQVALFDHGNFTDKNKSIRPKGGQTGHPDTNRERRENRQDFPKVRLFTKTCSQCGSAVNRVKAIKEKLLVDICLNPEVVKLLTQTERQWCSSCKKEVSVKHSQSLPFTEYGINTFLAVIILRFGASLSLAKIALVLQFSFGLTISKGEIAHLLSLAKIYLKDKYEILKQAARERTITYHDETGWLIRGQSGWMWIMTTIEGETIYVAAESRGKGIAKETYGTSQSTAMHDGLASYETVIPKNNQAYCWAHLLRFAFEETAQSKKSSDSLKIRDKLVEIYQFKKTYSDSSTNRLKTYIETELTNICQKTSKEYSFQKIQRRVKKQKEGLIQALLFTPDGTNNLAERELRPLVIAKRISFGSDTFTGMENTAVLGSVYRTTMRISSQPLLQLRKDLLAGVKKTYPKFLQVSVYDSFPTVKS